MVICVIHLEGTKSTYVNANEKIQGNGLRPPLSTIPLFYWNIADERGGGAIKSGKPVSLEHFQQ